MQKISKNKIKRDRIFDVYSRNFDWVKEHPNIRFEPDISGLYICPLCMNVFDKSCTSAESLTPLTLEDIPPKSLGGKPLVLTCKTCNSKAGHDLDIHVLNVLKEEALQNLSPNSGGKVVIEKDSKKMNGTIKIDENRLAHLDLRPEISNPSDTKYIVNKVINRRFKNVKTEELTVIFKKNGNLRRSEVGLLRLAYLLAFAKFGYGFIVNLNLPKIREQIQNPDKDILKQVFCIKTNFGDNYLGTNIIHSPKELFGFLVVFKLKSQSFNRNFGVILPGPTSPGMEIYDFIDNKLKDNDTKSINCLMQPFGNTNFLADKKYAFASHELWHHIVSGKFKPS